MSIYAKYETPVAFAGYYTSMNLCTTNAGYKVENISTSYRGAIGPDGVGIADKFKDWKFTDEGNGRFSAKKNTSTGVASYAIASDGTYFVTSHYGGPTSDPVCPDNLFGVNTGDSYLDSSSVKFESCTIASPRMWVVRVTVNSKEYIVYCDSVNDIFEVDVTLTSGGSEIGFDDIYSGGKFVSDLTISKGATALVNCTYSGGSYLTVTKA